jgi:GMP synthase (glutamine-hydrolysing)
LPALRAAEVLIRQGVARGVPVLGHCLGGQLMARALGAKVVASPAPEVGWHGVQIDAHALARAWLGDAVQAEVFHWHYESFELPAGATLLAHSAACPRQAFAMGPHLAMQFHVELDETKLLRWAADTDARYAQAHQHSSTVHAPAAMLADMQQRLAAQQALADRIYARWLDGASR